MTNINDLTKQIEKENEAFQKMTRAEKRVQIAKDALLRIKLGTLRPITGSTVIIPEEEVDSNLKKLLDKGIICEACAKGGLFLSYVGRVNEFNTGDIQDASNCNSNEMRKLREIFSKKQLQKIEYAFEGYDVTSDHLFSSKEEYKLEKFYYTYFEEDDRLIAICNNIIKNRGKFKP